MMLFAQGFAPALRRSGAIIAAALLLSPLVALADESKLTLHTDTGDYAFNVSVVDTPESRAKGLMYVTELADDAGMLFDFKEQRPVSFWMRNTFIPLDMIFVDAAGVVKNVHVNAIPHDPTGIPSDGPVQYVLEIPGGRSVEIGLKAGDKMDHDRIAAGQ
ncbi:hypothetical protein SAMN05428969_3564 [Devosia sp. YR412]|uniref:DUF192 domain-containing protein n=1 Tax=Devosia sp. YR412 TaxID=1881030 RepID=UPI0008BF17EE|nr:DUF192 domain-containing protein [Devosia sp. YR412]SEQ57615.1 hypothetical protein SAMN05428969_3564 [Devosia sp. YR412]